MTKIKVKLAKAARSTGGDKYEATSGVSFNVYVPQVISRAKTGHPSEELEITINHV